MCLELLEKVLLPRINGAAQPRQDRDETLRGLAEFFSESVHHVWSNDEIAQCLTEMIGQGSVVSSTAYSPPPVDNPLKAYTVDQLEFEIANRAAISPQSEVGK